MNSSEHRPANRIGQSNRKSAREETAHRDTADREKAIGKAPGSTLASGKSTAQSAVEVTAQPGVASRPKKNPIHSLVTTLPVIMLLAGLGFYFINERKQVEGELLFSQTVEFSGSYSGLSKQSDSVNAQRLLWVETGGRLRGTRINYTQFRKLSNIADKALVTVWAAPRVEGSATLWVVKLVSGSKVLLDEASGR
ncbi:hypothetical protein AB833_17015 [Chromatiales bacterium (ex Bugula neritina AB1)]|nr:hypothetical protein AB833_17015 [Chromatiales bacterium (ex Bugula neritina AB1)]